MSKRTVTSSRQSRKRKRAGVSYSVVDLDESPDKTEDIRVWDVTMSTTSGRVSATRKNYQHSYASPQEPLHEEPLHEEPPTAKDIVAPADPEPNELPPAESVAKRKRVRAVKENDSVCSTY